MITGNKCLILPTKFHLFYKKQIVQSYVLYDFEKAPQRAFSKVQIFKSTSHPVVLKLHGWDWFIKSVEKLRIQIYDIYITAEITLGKASEQTLETWFLLSVLLGISYVIQSNQVLDPGP